MPHAEPIDAMARLLAGAHRGRAIAVEANAGPRNVQEAYRVQEAVLRWLAPGSRPTAWKVSPARDGSDPLASPVPPAGVLASPASISAGERIRLGVEAEIAFRFGAAPRVDFAHADDALESVSEALVLLELCETRLADWSVAPELCRLADFQSHGAFVLGTGTRAWRDIDYARQEVEMRINNSIAVRAAGNEARRDIPGMVAWAVRHCARRGMPLAAGDVVTTGSWTGLTAIAPVERVTAIFPGIGEASLTLGH